MQHEDMQNAIILCLMQRLGIREISLSQPEVVTAIADITEGFKYNELFVGIDNGKMTARIEGR